MAKPEALGHWVGGENGCGPQKARSRHARGGLTPPPHKDAVGHVCRFKSQGAGAGETREMTTMIGVLGLPHLSPYRHCRGRRPLEGYSMEGWFLEARVAPCEARARNDTRESGRALQTGEDAALTGNW